MTDEGWKDRADRSSKTVGKSLARAAQAIGEELGEECTERAEYARGEESKRKSKNEHRVISDRPVCVPSNSNERAYGKENECRLAAEAVSH